jgi:hypothetical protein
MNIENGITLVAGKHHDHGSQVRPGSFTGKQIRAWFINRRHSPLVPVSTAAGH